MHTHTNLLTCSTIETLLTFLHEKHIAFIPPAPLEKETDIAAFRNTLYAVLKKERVPCFIDSLHHTDHATYLLVYMRHLQDRLLLVFGTKKVLQSIGFTASMVPYHDYHVLCCPTTEKKNTELLRRLYPHTAPRAILSEPSATGACTSIGLGDRLGLCTAGHIALLQQYAITPVFAQQSKRELMLTGRTYSDVIDAATWDVFATNYRGAWGADGDHLKSPEEVSDALRQGCTMITADPSDALNITYIAADTDTIHTAFSTLDASYRARLLRTYCETSFHIARPHAKDITVQFSESDIARIALIYHDALRIVQELYATTQQFSAQHNTPVDFEVSIDETTIPTSPQAHVFVVQEMRHAHIVFQSLAIRYSGEFQKGIDFIGDTRAFSEELETHHAIKEYFNAHTDSVHHSTYKLSIHSGSDKFSIFPIIGTTLAHNFHIKTSGTNWLVALYTIAMLDPALFRKIHRIAYDVYPRTSQYYHITPNFSSRCDIASITNSQLHEVLDNTCDRQVLHISYGEILQQKDLAQNILGLLYHHTEEYWNNLNSHIAKHLNLLGCHKK